jgi:hypothetical protein
MRRVQLVKNMVLWQALEHSTELLGSKKAGCFLTR